MASASLSHVGRVRDLNEDAVLEKGNLFAVADGMGGHRAGEVASALALSVIEQYVEDNIGIASGERLVEQAVASANAAVHRKARSSARYSNMGTTVTMLYREGDTAYLGHVGDSRAYLYRNGSLKRLTSDHSLVAALVEEGEITEEEARHHPQRNIIVRALGLQPQVEVDIISVKIEQGDEFLLASDGLTGLLEDKRIERELAAGRSPADTARALVDRALEEGGDDNVSVVLVRFAGSDTLIPVVRPDEEGGVAEAGDAAAPAVRRTRRWTLTIAVILLLLLSGFGITYYFYNRTFFIGVKGGKVTMFRGFPFWGAAVVEKETEVKVSYLPDYLRRRVENRLEPGSRREAEDTLRRLEKEAAKSVVMPDVVGSKVNEARNKLESLSLKVKIELKKVPGVPADKVLEQFPVAGTRLGRGSEVRLKVTLGGEQKGT